MTQALFLVMALLAIAYAGYWAIQNDPVRSVAEQRGWLRMRPPRRKPGAEAAAGEGRSVAGPSRASPASRTVPDS